MSGFCPDNPQRFAAAIAAFDAANAADPNRVIVHGLSEPRELAYARWLTGWVLRLCPDAPEPLRLAARCQHLQRWEIPRSSHPATRAGYLKWRQTLKEFHAARAGDILRAVGYDEATIREVQALNLKQNFPADPLVRVLEDALCLVFLEHQFTELAAKATEEKMIAALQKCWAKMTPAAHAEALNLAYPAKGRELLERALRRNDAVGLGSAPASGAAECARSSHRCARSG